MPQLYTQSMLFRKLVCKVISNWFGSLLRVLATKVRVDGVNRTSGNVNWIYSRSQPRCLFHDDLGSVGVWKKSLYEWMWISSVTTSQDSISSREIIRRIAFSKQNKITQNIYRDKISQNKETPWIFRGLTVGSDEFFLAWRRFDISFTHCRFYCHRQLADKRLKHV